MANTQTAVKSKTNKLLLLVLSALFAAMITVMTAFLFHIPIGVNGGYLHFGDALIYLAASMLPRHMPASLRRWARGLRISFPARRSGRRLRL